MNGRFGPFIVAVITFLLGVVGTGFLSMSLFGNRVTALEVRVESLQEDVQELKAYIIPTPLEKSP